MTIKQLPLWTCLSLFFLMVGGTAAAQTGAAAENGLEDFQERLQKYMELHKRVQDTIPPVDEASHPELIIPRQKKLAEGIRLARMRAKQGDIFTPSVRTLIVNIIRKELAGPTGTEARSKIMGEGNPGSPETPAKVALEINATYPAEAPRSTIPPFLLIRLPELPEGLEYRFVGRNLVLLDVKANLIVDILPQAVS
jgi:hypothetical protein